MGAGYLITMVAAVAAFHATVAQAEEVLLRHGDIQVTSTDVERYVQDRIPADAREGALARNGVVHDIVENIFIIRALAAEAAIRQELDHELIEWRADLQRNRLMMDALLNQRVQSRLDSQDWDAAAREVYTAQADKFRTEEQVRASHILIKTDRRTDAEALTLARELRERALQGEDFAELAKAYSEDASVQQNAGDLGYFGRGKMVPPFEEAAFSMGESGAISAPVKTRFGYHLIRFQERQDARQQEFAEVKEKIIKELRQDIANNTRQTEVIRMRSSPGIEWNEKGVEATQERLRTRAE